ncbi:nitrate reductase [Aliiroseovarius sp.]|uniref:nitrate reductase n=1 Tax=Aliiroseovarius sp. TaxID=1872442 RepID=UPI002602E268|nr:nitrate reductase [Aliiroseovarius sp.]
MSTCTTCPYCGVGCGVLAGADGTIKGDPNHPANAGRLCSKGTQLGETIGLEGRLLAPRLNGQDTDWDSALGLVADTFRAAIDEHGPDSVAFYVSGQLLTEDYYAANKLMKGYIGSANIDTNSRLCMASSVAGHKRAFGSDTVPGCYEDIEEADLVVLVGSNLAWCHPVLYQRLVAAKAARPGMRVVNIDPRRTATSDVADTHLSVAPDGDVALFNAVLCRIVDERRVDAGYVATHVNGFDVALDAARAAGATGLSAEELDRFTKLWAGTEKVVTIYSQGVNQSVCGTDKVNAILNCHLATGRIGRPGMGPFSVTGQPNAMGGREVGGLANMLANHLDIENPAHRAAMQGFWNSPTICKTPGLKAVDLYRACAEGRIKALWVMSTNPAVSMPEADAVAEAIRAVPFVVVSDILERTDTGDLADVLLPAAGWGEKSGTVTNSERVISRQRAFLPRPGQVRPDWQIIADVARRMGFDGFDWADEAEVFDEYARSTTVSRDFGRDLDLTGLAGLRRGEYDALSPIQWPVPGEGAPGGRFFAEGGFFHADGKAKMLPTVAPQLATPPESYPFTLNTGRVRDHWHTMTRTGRSARLSRHMAEPYVELHPEDAVALGLRDADLARVSSPTGIAVLRVLITARARRGSVFVPMHWTKHTAADGRVGPLVAADTDPVSGQPASKGGFVAVEKYRPGWQGFLACVNPIALGQVQGAVAAAPNGFSAELFGEAPTDWEALARILASEPNAVASQITDPARGATRIALERDGDLVALFLAGPGPVEAARSHLLTRIGQPANPLPLLAGRNAADRPDPGPTVCACMGVGANDLKAAIAGGCHTVEALGEATQAGTSCGSCKPELASLIATHTPVAAE